MYVYVCMYNDIRALVIHTERALQCITSCFAEDTNHFRVEVNLKLTEILHQPALQEEYRMSHITIAEAELNSVQQLVYLGFTISLDVSFNKEVGDCLVKANKAFCRLHKHLWKNKHLKISTKTRVYRVIVHMILLDSSES